PPKTAAHTPLNRLRNSPAGGSNHLTGTTSAHDAEQAPNSADARDPGEIPLLPANNSVLSRDRASQQFPPD
ncbi:hypothetical protein, partial [Paractinoplanes durhamensis]